MPRDNPVARNPSSTIAGLIAAIGLTTPIAGVAQQAIDLGTVGSSATGDAAAKAPASRAAAVAVTQSSLKATQPQSIINRSFFEEVKPIVSDMSAIAVAAPSVTLGISTNGPGLGETKVGIRGFKDGEFNITYDGIPFGDTNGPTHHSTAYFPAEVLGRVEIERGPGNASNFGQATFGGSLNLFSRDLARERTIAPYASFGTWNTRVMGVRVDSGTLEQFGDALLAINYQDMSSDGYRTHSPLGGQNFMLKFQKPVGESTLVTLNVNFNKNWYSLNDNEKGITQAQADALGKNFALGDDPRKANYWKYNHVEKSTNMSYLRVQSDLGGGWEVDNNTYYYNYTNNGLTTSATDLTTGLGNVTGSTGVVQANQMPGGIKINEYWVAGDIFKATRQTSAGLARIGVWAEKADTHRAFYDFNLLNGAPNYDQAAVAGVLSGVNNTKYEQKSGWRQYQPFAEFEWNVAEGIKVTPGLKYMRTDLGIDASVNQTARVEQHLAKRYTATLPFLAANYAFQSGWSAYAQLAKGMLVPNIGSYQSANADASAIAPQSSFNRQIGIVHQADKITFDADLYYISFNNKIATMPGSPAAQPIFYNQGGVDYSGAEGQVSYVLGGGFSVSANGSLNRASKRDTGKQIAGVPNTTSALGLLYGNGPFNATMFYKRVGTTYALDDQAYSMSAYSTTDLGVSYKFINPGAMAKGLKIQLSVANLFNRQSIVSVSPTNTNAALAVYGAPTATDFFGWQPPRSVMTTVRGEF